uniref:RNA polymerase II transcriptional coactivator n=1 Tax=Riptortus pedestris TaxID=329032 RepID=R4WJP6_RIPPE|nr:RNA polymerase II transcriptional coactivator [Riptortus pedestris]
MAPRKNSKRSDSTSDSGPDDPEPKPAAKKAKTSTAKDDDEPSWAIDTKRFVKVREFKGKVMVDIREYYDAGGEMKPGKKGICLSVQQWRKLVDVIDEVDKAIKEK